MILSFTVRERHCRESNLEPTAWNSTVRPTESYFEDVIRPATLWSWRQPILNIVGIVLVRFWICCEYVFHLPVSDELKKINTPTVFLPLFQALTEKSPFLVFSTNDPRRAEGSSELALSTKPPRASSIRVVRRSDGSGVPAASASEDMEPRWWSRAPPPPPR